jgi:hypothetical protein
LQKKHYWILTIFQKDYQATLQRSFSLNIKPADKHEVKI